MHHFFEIDEILLQVIDFVACDCNKRKAKSSPRKDLRALALTSRLFHAPAIKLLWRSLNTPMPLLLVLPKKLWEVREREEYTYNNTRYYTFLNQPVGDEWNRFDELALFVEQLGVVDRRDKSPIDAIVMDQFVRRDLENRGTVLLPNLHSIYASSNDLPHTSLFLSPKLTHLQLMMHPRHMNQLIALTVNIPEKSPDVKVLRLSESVGWDAAERNDYYNILGYLLADLQLEELHCDWIPLSEDMMKDLLVMPNLKVLNIHRELWGLKADLEEQPLRAPRLEQLYLSVDHIHIYVLSQIVPLLRPSRLKVFSVISKLGTPVPEEVSDLFSMIGRHCTTEHLTDLVLDHTSLSPMASTPPAGSIKFDVLKPLLPLTNLRVVSLTSYSIALTDDDTKELASSWPHLEKLNFDTGRTRNKIRTTLKSLLYFATFCPKLNDLAFRFEDDEDIEQVSVKEVEAAEGHSLRFLSVGYSVITEATSVTDFLNFVFPKLSNLTVHPNNSASEQWDEVQEMFEWQ